MKGDMEPIAIYLVDRSTLFRDGIKALLGEAGFVIRREARLIQELLTQPDDGAPPHIILSDLAMGDPLFSRHLLALRERFPDVRIVILTDEINPERLSASLEAGADGYLLKDISVEALQQSLRLVMLGEKVMPAGITAPAADSRGIELKRKSHQAILSKMSGRETEVLKYLLQGLSNKAIGNELKISEGTVKVHLKGILKKINVRNRTQAVIWAMVNGVSTNVTPSEAPAGAIVARSNAVSPTHPSLPRVGLPEAVAGKSSLRVLIVEDELLVSMYIEQTVRELGYEVIGSAGTLADAKRLFEAASFDVAILDVRLRQGELIYPAIDILRDRRIPFVFITGYGSDNLERQYGRHPILKKPFSQRELQRCIQNVVEVH
jgi:two-component system, NarL family, nitrate/nitrite response regulator NarL